MKYSSNTIQAPGTRLSPNKSKTVRVGDKPMTSENLKIALATFKDWSGTYNAPLSYAPPTTVNADPNHCIQLQQVGTDGKLVTVDGKRFQCWEGTVAPA